MNYFSIFILNKSYFKIIFSFLSNFVNFFWKQWTRLRGGKQVISGMSIEKNKSFETIKELYGAGKLRVVIDRRYPLEDIALANAHVETGHKKGNVVITVSH